MLSHIQARWVTIGGDRSIRADVGCVACRRIQHGFLPVRHARATNLAGRVIWLTEDAAFVTLENLRITDGVLNDNSGAGVLNQGAGLVMTNCAVTANQGSNLSGAGIYSVPGLQMTACEISNNISTSEDQALASGIYTEGPSTLTHCQITGNETSGEGGGLVVASGATSLAGQTVISGNVAAAGGGILMASGASLTVDSTCQVTHNTAAELYGGIANRGTVTLQGSSPATIVVNNCPGNCLDVPGCTNAQVDCPN